MTLDEEDERWLSSKRKFAGYYTIGLFVVLLIATLLWYFASDKAANLKHTVELTQATLICSTALLGLGGLIILEFKKVEEKLTNTLTQNREDVLKKIKVLNRLSDIAFGVVFLRSSAYLSIIAIVSGCLYLLSDNSIWIVFSLCSFFIQIIAFVYGLLFSHF